MINVSRLKHQVCKQFSGHWYATTNVQIYQHDKLRPTAAGLDGIPAWFLRLAAPVFAAAIAQLFIVQSDACRRQDTTAVEDGHYHTGAESQQTDIAE